MAESSTNLSIEQVFHNDLQQHLTSIDRVDAHFPEMPDIEELWSQDRRKLLARRNERVRQISHGIIGMDNVHRHGYRQVLGRGLGIIQ